MTTPHPTSREILERLAAELTSRQYDAYTLRILHGWPYQRIADTLGVDKSTAYQHVATAIRKAGRIQWEGAWPHDHQ